ncbi:hypothetical protein Tco_0309805 [Tanacetum coccineum]
MHTTMVPEQVKTMKIQAGIQVSRPRELTRQLQLWKRFGRLYLIVFVLVRNIDSRSRISQRVDMDSQWVDLLMGDRMTLQEIVWMVEEEAYASRESWAHLIGLSQATHQELQTHYDHRLIRHSYSCRVLSFRHNIRREMSDMQAELLALREQQRRARQPGLEARIPDC